MPGESSRLLLLDPEKLQWVLDTYNRMSQSVESLVKLFENLPEAERDSLVALTLSHIKATPKMILAYTKQEAIYNEIRAALGEDAPLVKLLYLRYIAPKRKILLAMQPILVELKHALQDAPTDPEERAKWIAEHGAKVQIDGLGLPEEQKEESDTE